MSEEPHDELLPGPDALTDLRGLTAARVAMGRSGTSVRTQEHLAFQLDHAAARDAVGMEMDVATLTESLLRLGLQALHLQSFAAANTGGEGRRTYLQRPDLGRRLSRESAEKVRVAAAGCSTRPEVIFVLADGLSALAVERNALPLLRALQPALPTHGWTSGPVCIVRDGRVAVGDEVGELFGAALTVMLIGERPGLSAADSMGLYLTWTPRIGRTDAERNCISNVRFGGISHDDAARRLLSLMDSARAAQRSGVELQGGAGMAPSLR